MSETRRPVTMAAMAKAFDMLGDEIVTVLKAQKQRIEALEGRVLELEAARSAAAPLHRRDSIEDLVL